MTVHAPDTASPLRWQDSITTLVTRRYAEPRGRDGATERRHVSHHADFMLTTAIDDLTVDFSHDVKFAPTLVRATWINGDLRSVAVSGPRRLVSGRLSDASHCNREWYADEVDRTKMPEAIVQGLAAYERAVVGVAANGGDTE